MTPPLRRIANAWLEAAAKSSHCPCEGRALCPLPPEVELLTCGLNGAAFFSGEPGAGLTVPEAAGTRPAPRAWGGGGAASSVSTRVYACVWTRVCGGRGGRMGEAGTKAAPLLVAPLHYLSVCISCLTITLFKQK